MDIKEAVKEAVEIGGFIERKAFGNENAFRKYKIKPTNTRATCIVYVLDKNDQIVDCYKDWNPTEDDLTAEDWEVSPANDHGLIYDNMGFQMHFKSEIERLKNKYIENVCNMTMQFVKEIERNIKDMEEQNGRKGKHKNWFKEM